MKSPAKNGVIGAAGLGLASVLAAPFAFGAISLNVWVTFAWFWIFLGVVAVTTGRSARPLSPGDPLRALSWFCLAAHLVFALQLIPLPPVVLRLISPGSYAAAFIPPLAVPAWAPLTASPAGTRQAWLFFTGLHALSIAILGAAEKARAARMTWLFFGMAAAGAVLALEGLVQSASTHPFWLYGLVEVPGAGSHEKGIFGPYYNRDHYSNLIAIAASIAAGLLSLRIPPRKEGGPRWFDAPTFPSQLGLSVALALMLAASAASGSRGGLAALAAGVLVGLASTLRARPRLVAVGALLGVAVLFGTGVPSSVVRLTDLDFEASRLMVWRDTLRLVGFFPIFGCGLGAFAPAYWPYQRVVRFEYWPHAHNEYLQWLLEAGLAGSVLFLFAARMAWLEAPRIFRDPQLRPALAGLVAASVHALVECAMRIPANGAWTFLLAACLFAGARPLGEKRGRP